jgi:DNA-binding XRE family transcriptional regulator
MDQWDFKKWRKKLGVNQVEAGAMLGLSRGAIQSWEREITPVPRALELACNELLRRWKQRPEFAPVFLMYADAPMPEADPPARSDLLLRCESHPNNKSALTRVLQLSETAKLFMPLILGSDGTVIWSGPELLQECESKKRARRPELNLTNN